MFVLSCGLTFVCGVADCSQAQLGYVASRSVPCIFIPNPRGDSYLGHIFLITGSGYLIGLVEIR